MIYCLLKWQIYWRQRRKERRVNTAEHKKYKINDISRHEKCLNHNLMIAKQKKKNGTKEQKQIKHQIKENNKWNIMVMFCFYAEMRSFHVSEVFVSVLRENMTNNNPEVIINKKKIIIKYYVSVESYHKIIEWLCNCFIKWLPTVNDFTIFFFNFQMSSMKRNCVFFPHISL